MLGGRLIRLQCYEGLDVTTAVYEWNYPRQMLEIRLLEARGQADKATAHDIFGPEFLSSARCSRHSSRPTARRPSCSSTRSTARTRSSRRTCWRSCPTSRSPSRRSARSGPPAAARGPDLQPDAEVHDALKRRCLYHWIDYPTAARSSRSSRARAGHPRAAGPPGGRVRPAAARGGPDQAAGRGRDARLGIGAGRARGAGAGPE